MKQPNLGTQEKTSGAPVLQQVNWHHGRRIGHSVIGGGASMVPWNAAVPGVCPAAVLLHSAEEAPGRENVVRIKSGFELAHQASIWSRLAPDVDVGLKGPGASQDREM